MTALASISNRPPKVALVIGSGSLKCAAALGLLRVLRREKIAVDMTVGCSGGSIYASVIALGWDTEKATRENTRLWPNVFNRLSARSLLNAALPRLFGFDEHFGIVHDKKLNWVMHELFGDEQFSSTTIPLHIVATDMRTGEKVVLSSGLIRDAVRASIAIPVLLRPWTVGGRLLFDGGASDPLPVDVAIREQAEIIIAMGFENPVVEHVRSAMGLVFQTSAITVNHLLKSTYAFYNAAHHAEIIPIIPSFDRPVGLRDTHLIPYIVEQGEKAAEREMPYLRKVLGGVVSW